MLNRICSVLSFLEANVQHPFARDSAHKQGCATQRGRNQGLTITSARLPSKVPWWNYYTAHVSSPMGCGCRTRQDTSKQFTDWITTRKQDTVCCVFCAKRNGQRHQATPHREMRLSRHSNVKRTGKQTDPSLVRIAPDTLKILHNTRSPGHKFASGFCTKERKQKNCCTDHQSSNIFHSGTHQQKIHRWQADEFTRSNDDSPRMRRSTFM